MAHNVVAATVAGCVTSRWSTAGSGDTAWQSFRRVEYALRQGEDYENCWKLWSKVLATVAAVARFDSNILLL